MPTLEQRERVAAQLCEHFAAGHLELDVLESRLAAVDSAGNSAELKGLVGDLPALEAKAPAVAEQPTGRGWALALMGGSSRKGEWFPARKLNAVALMGGVELDFRDARLGAGENRVTAIAVMGGIEIIVPPDLPVTVRGLGVLGAVNQVEQSAAGSDPSEPRLRVMALACMGAIEVKTRASKQAELSAHKQNETKR